MTIATKPFDAAKYTNTPEAQEELLVDALETGHAGYIAAALGTIARARGMGQVAVETGLSRQALYAALSEGGNPTLDTVLKVTKALGLELTARHPKALVDA